ncbi:MAG TPA: M23 family metallopeptidase [Spirochaetales bacterium]|nr:M23 family metallopeptidase [Spirochaetales bacterium]HPS14238.1 M23 family metallopeptidase [Spirochaetales bacterium]
MIDKKSGIPIAANGKPHRQLKKEQRFALVLCTLLCLGLFATFLGDKAPVLNQSLGAKIIKGQVVDNVSAAVQERSSTSIALPDVAYASPHYLVEQLTIETIASLDYASLFDLGSLLARQAIATSSNPEKLVAAVFPSAMEVLAMLARDRDVDDYLESASDGNSSGSYYSEIAALAPRFRPLRTQFEAIYAAVYEVFSTQGRTLIPWQTSKEAMKYQGGVTLPGLSSRPREADYDYSHTYALDIFFNSVRTLPLTGGRELGPTVFSVSDGIIIAADSSWRGGEELKSYKGGGITPKAGNGVIVFSPSEKRYYSYFHLHDVLVEPGNVIKAGQPIGHGGNTGANAARPGHGEHVHVEIYDAANAQFLRNRDIAAIIF